MPFVLTKEQRFRASEPARMEFKENVKAHAKRKIVFEQELSDDDYNAIADDLYDRVYRFLAPYPTATYDSFVMLLIVYFIRGIDQIESPHFLESLTNERFGINTRIRITYDLTKYLMRAGY